MHALQHERVTRPEDYGPKEKPVIIQLAEALRMKKQQESSVEQVSEYVSIVDRPETHIIGIGVPVSFESQGYGYGAGVETVGYAMNDYVIARKYIPDGTVALLAEAVGVDLTKTEIISLRRNNRGDGNYDVIIGFVTDSVENLPVFLPEYTVTFTVPAGRFVKMLINEKKTEGREGYEERMHADEYFVNEFRTNTPYVYDKSSVPLNTYDAAGDMLAKYEPVKVPAGEAERYDSIEYKPVLLPPMKIACCISGANDDFVIFKYFNVQNEVFKTSPAVYYMGDYYGFPINDANEPQGYKSAFGSRVTDFDGLPDCVERITLPGGEYIHVTQLEVNGDNPSVPYEVAFNHMNLCFDSFPGYEVDWSRKVIARFRQANCASVFVPVKRS